MDHSFFLRTSQHFYRAFAILEPQIYVVSEQFEAENISLLSGRLVSSSNGSKAFDYTQTTQTVAPSADH